ncbi:MAG: hypothetical protein L0Z49_08785 [Actinobacteria bacterium]|nr:hypothetical protein [Actinomycetota bacterium]
MTDSEHLSERVVPLSSWLVPTAAVVGVVVLVAIALLRGPTTFDPTTPEGAVQEYLVAIEGSQWEDAFAILDPDSFAECDPEDIAANGEQQPFTAVHDNTEISGDTAFVLVRLQFGDQGPLGTGWTQQEQFTLTESDGFWYLTQDPWPYFRWACEQF